MWRGLEEYLRSRFPQTQEVLFKWSGQVRAPRSGLAQERHQTSHQRTRTQALARPPPAGPVTHCVQVYEPADELGLYGLDPLNPLNLPGAAGSVAGVASNVVAGAEGAPAPVLPNLASLPALPADRPHVKRYIITGDSGQGMTGARAACLRCFDVFAAIAGPRVSTLWCWCGCLSQTHAGSAIAAMVLSDAITGRPNPWSHLYSPSRVNTLLAPSTIHVRNLGRVMLGRRGCSTPCRIFFLCPCRCSTSLRAWAARRWRR